MGKLLKVLALGVLALVAYLAFWPIPIQPVAWPSPASAGYAGPHAANDRLARLQMIQLATESGPEHIAMGRDGKLYTAVASGKVLRMNPDGTGQEVFAQTGGRILGFAFDAAGNLVGADATRGLVSISPDGVVTLLTDKVDGDPIRYADAVAIAKNGKVYFSDASTRFSAATLGVEEASLLEVVEQSASGRVLEYDPATKRTRKVADGFSFSNGVVLSRDEKSLFVNDTGRYRIWKVDLAGATPPQVFMDNLPGYPDNLTRGLDGRIWCGIFAPRNPDADTMNAKPLVRQVIMRLPRALWPLPKHYGHVFAFTEDGKVVTDLQDPAGSLLNTTGATETADRIYVHSLKARAIGWMRRPAT